MRWLAKISRTSEFPGTMSCSFPLLMWYPGQDGERHRPSSLISACLISLIANRISSAGVGRESMNLVSSFPKFVANAATSRPSFVIPFKTLLPCQHVVRNVSTHASRKDTLYQSSAGGGRRVEAGVRGAGRKGGRREAGGVRALDFVSELTKGVADVIDKLRSFIRRLL